MAASRQILDLRQLLAERFAQPVIFSGSPQSTGIPGLDNVTGGGLHPGLITEIISPRLSAGSALLIHALLLSAMQQRTFVALIDGSDSFDPQTAGSALLPHLLWLRCHHASEAVKAADLLVRDGNFPLVMLDLILNSADELRKIPSAHWYRLQRLVEPAPTALLVLSQHHLVAGVRMQLVLEQRWTLDELERDDTISRLRPQRRRSSFALRSTA
ncbi:MAG: hypothetical protein M3R59_07660 [Verrucomicrobiota bacterium]|nr:hypothetical protein [Verrucomicrobiota bacterium]